MADASVPNQSPISRQDSGWSSVPNWVIRSDKLKGSEKLLYIALLNRANSKGECWPSLATLSSDVGVSTRTVLRKLDDLENKGLIRKTRRANASVGNVSNIYRVLTFEEPAPSDKVSPASDNEHMPLVTPCRNPSDNELQEVLPIEVLPSRSTTQLSARDLEELFDWAYSKWPKKEKRKHSLDKFLLLSKKHDPNELATKIVTFADAYRESISDPQFVPALVVWLNGERWTDDLPKPRSKVIEPSRSEAALSFVNRLEQIDATSRSGEITHNYRELR